MELGLWGGNWLSRAECLGNMVIAVGVGHRIFAALPLMVHFHREVLYRLPPPWNTFIDMISISQVFFHRCLSAGLFLLMKFPDHSAIQHS